MTITLELLPNVEAGLAAQAQAQGLQLGDYIQRLLEQAAGKRSEKIISPGGTTSARYCVKLVLHSWAALNCSQL